MRLKVMEFWMCSEIGVESNKSESTKENLKIVVVESLANISELCYVINNCDLLFYHEITPQMSFACNSFAIIFKQLLYLVTINHAICIVV